MKRIIPLLTLVFATHLLSAQTKAGLKVPALAPEIRNHGVIKPVQKTNPRNERVVNLTVTPNPTVASPAGRSSRSEGEVNIGRTNYDLQTNASMPRRIINYEGKVSAIWTFSKLEDPEHPDRGIAYNHFDGSDWINLPDYANIRNNQKIEQGDVRTGFGSLGYISDVGEVVIAHTPDNLFMSKNQQVGNQTWTGEQLTSFPPYVWSRIATEGKNIHMIAWVDTAVWNGDTLFRGLTSSLLYSRSTDGGQTWDIQHAELPGIDSTRYSFVSGDSYSIDVRGDVVAIGYGSEVGSIIMIRSNDNGENWTYRVVKEFPYSPWDDQLTIVDGQQDTVNTTDGSVTVHIDKNNLVHLWYGAMRITKGADLEPGFITYFPATAGIYYWNENFQEGQDNALIAAYNDENGDEAVDIMIRFGSYTKNSLGQYVYVGNTEVGPFPYSSVGGTTTPTVGEDAEGTLYMVYQAYKEGEDFYHIAFNSRYGPSYRHLFMIRSSDGGATWSDAVDLTTGLDRGFDPFLEYAYPSLARLVDDNLHLVYQSDEFPGNYGGVDDNNYHPIAENRIVYQSVPKNFEIGMREVKQAKSDIRIHPNPASESATIGFRLAKTEPGNVRVSNLLGQDVFSTGVRSIPAGSHSIQLNTSILIPGVYLVTVEHGNSTSTSRLVIAH